MAIFHYTIKIVGRSKGKSVISASAYLNGDVMKNEETGRISYYTSKKEVVYKMCIRDSVYVGKLYQKEIDFVAQRSNEKFYIQISDNISGQETFERECFPRLQI